MRILFFVLLVFFSESGLAKVSCPPANIEQLKQMVHKEKQKKLIFFSSWCLDCLEHLKAADVENSIFIAAFDKPERAAQTLEKLGINPKRCVFDDGLTKHYQIKKVPAEIQIGDTHEWR